MPGLVDQLMHEHRAFERVLLATEATALAIHRGAPVPDLRFLTDVVTYFVRYADGQHHGREEGVLFPLMLERGLPTASGPVACMLMEHNQGRAIAQRMSRAARAVTQGQSAEAAEWAEAALLYAQVLRAHIQREDRIVFPLALELVPEADAAAALKVFEARMELEAADVHALADALVARAAAWWPSDVSPPPQADAAAD